MQGATVQAERSLRGRLRRLAEARLEPGAVDKAIEELTERLYHGPRHRDAGRRTRMEQWRRERVERATQDALERARAG